MNVFSGNTIGFNRFLYALLFNGAIGNICKVCNPGSRLGTILCPALICTPEFLFTVCVHSLPVPPSSIINLISAEPF